jgi:hypothetical protein
MPSLYLPDPGEWLFSLHDFLADSECSLAIANSCTVYLLRVHNRIFVDGVLVGWYGCLSDIGTSDAYIPRLQARRPKVPYTEQDEVAMSMTSWPTLVGSILPIPHPLYTRFADHPATPIPDPRTRPDRTWPAYYGLLLQLICQMLSPSATAPSGTAAFSHYDSRGDHVHAPLLRSFDPQ